MKVIYLLLSLFILLSCRDNKEPKSNKDNNEIKDEVLEGNLGEQIASDNNVEKSNTVSPYDNPDFEESEIGSTLTEDDLLSISKRLEMLQEGNDDRESEYNTKYSDYEETSSCVDGYVVYEGSGDYYIVETSSGYTILETYGGYLNEGDRIRGELNKFSSTYIIKKRTDSEVRVYIEDYMLSKSRAIEWLGEHKRLKYRDQEDYDNSKEPTW